MSCCVQVGQSDRPSIHPSRVFCSLVSQSVQPFTRPSITNRFWGLLGVAAFFLAKLRLRIATMTKEASVSVIRIINLAHMTTVAISLYVLY